MIPPHRQKLVFAVSILFALIALLVLIIFTITVSPLTLETAESEAQIYFYADRNQVLLASECVEVQWRVENIREVYLNGLGVIGEGTSLVCPWHGSPTLSVTYLDGSSRTYELPVTILAMNPLFWGLAISIPVLLVFAGMVIDLPAFRQTRILWKRGIRRIAEVVRWIRVHPIIIVCTLTLMGGVLRIHHLDTQSLVLDEAAMVWISSGNINDVIAQNAASNSAPPLYALFINLLLQFGRSEALLRSLSALAGIACIPAMYALAARLYSRSTAYFCTLVIAIAPVQVEYAQYLREYSLSVLLAILILYTFYLYVRQPNRRHWVYLVICWGAAILTQYGLALLILALNTVFLVEIILSPHLRPAVKGWISAQSTVLVVVAAVYLLSLRQHLGSGSFGAESWYSIAYWSGIPRDLLPYIVNGVTGIIVFAFSNPAFFILLFIGILALIMERFRRVEALILILPFVVFAMTGLNSLYPFVAGRQTLLLTVLVYLLAGAGFEYLLSLKGQRVILIATFVGVGWLVQTGLSGIQAYYESPGYEHSRPVVETLEAVYQPEDRLFVLPYAFHAFNYYFLHHHPDVQFTMGISDLPSGYRTQLRSLLDEPGRIWVFLNCCEEDFVNLLVEFTDYTSSRVANSTNVSLYLLEPIDQ